MTTCAHPYLAAFFAGGLAGLYLLLIGMIVWSLIDYWWFRVGRIRYRRWKLGRLKPLIVQRWRHVYGVEHLGRHGAFWCITRGEGEEHPTFRAGNAHSPEIAYARWRHNPQFWSGGHPVLKWK